MIYNIIRAILIGIILSVILVYAVVIYSLPKEKITDAEVRAIYARIVASTGQTQDAVPLEILNDPTINAYTDGDTVYIYRGIINYAADDDEIALILGHEVAHNMLRHTKFDQFHVSTLEVSESEANADKMGAFYMMRAGYDICTARNIWKRFRNDYGDSQGEDHPTASYRYAQLNIGCGDN